MRQTIDFSRRGRLMKHPGRAYATPTHLHAIPRAGGAITRLVCARLRKAKIPLPPLLAKAGLTIEQIDDDSSRVKASSQVKFLGLAAEALQDEFLGLHVSRDFDLRRTGLFYYVLASSNNISDALHRAERYSQIVNEGIVLKCSTTKEVVIALDYVGVERRSDKHQIEFWLVSLVRLCRQLANRRFVPRRVRLVHFRSKPPAELRSLLGCKIEFGAGADEIVFSAAIKATPLVGTDNYLNEILVKYCEEALAHRVVASKSLRSRVEKTIATLLPHGKARAPIVARSLGMSPRSLMRHLALEGLTFSRILEQQKIDLASHYLRESRFSISQIGWLLGYQEASAFTHAFKRWTGTSPTQARS